MSSIRRGVQALSRTAGCMGVRRPAGFLTVPRRVTAGRGAAYGKRRSHLAVAKGTAVAAFVAARAVSPPDKDEEEASGTPSTEGYAAGFGSGSGGPESDNDTEIPGLDLQGLLQVGKQLATPEFMAQLGFGGAMGFCAGYALKKVGRTAVLAVGITFVAVQAAIHYKVLKADAVNWDEIKGWATSALDTDGDGEVSAADLKAHWKSVVKMLGFNMGSAGAFAGAMLLGLHSG